MTTTEILIHNRDDLLPGDLLRVWPAGYPDKWAEGPIYTGIADAWLVGGRFIRWESGEWTTDRFDLTAHPARREAPTLPTERGSVVRVTSLDGTRLPSPRIGVRVGVGNAPRPWSIGGYGYRSAEEITSWVPLTVTEAGPEVTR